MRPQPPELENGSRSAGAPSIPGGIRGIRGFVVDVFGTVRAVFRGCRREELPPTGRTQSVRLVLLVPRLDLVQFSSTPSTQALHGRDCLPEGWTSKRRTLLRDAAPCRKRREFLVNNPPGCAELHKACGSDAACSLPRYNKHD